MEMVIFKVQPETSQINEASLQRVILCLGLKLVKFSESKETCLKILENLWQKFWELLVLIQSLNII